MVLVSKASPITAFNRKRDKGAKTGSRGAPNRVIELKFSLNAR